MNFLPITYKRMKIIVVALYLTILVLVAMQLYMKVYYLTEFDRQMVPLEREITVLKAQNIILKERLLQDQSLTLINQKAKEAGFVEAKYIYLP